MGTGAPGRSSGGSSAPTGLSSGRPGVGARIVPAIRAFSEQRGEDLWLREGGYLRSPAPRAGCGGRAGRRDRPRRSASRRVRPARSPAEVAGALPLARVSLRRPLPRRRDRCSPRRLARALRRAVLDRGHAALRADPRRPVEPRVPEHARDDRRAGREPSRSSWRRTPGADRLAPRGEGRLTNFGSYVVLTEPVPELLEEIGWTGGEAISDGRMFLHYFRTTTDGRVLMGSGSGPIGSGGRIDARFSTTSPRRHARSAGLRRLLPALADARIERGMGRPDRRLGRSRSVLRHRSGTPHPLRRRVLGQRRRSELARWSDPGLSRDRRDDEWTRLPLVDRSVRSLPPEPLPPCRRRRRSLCHPRL